MSQLKDSYRFISLFGVCQLDEALPQILHRLPDLPDSTFCEIFNEVMELGPNVVPWKSLETSLLKPILPLGQTRVKKCLEEIGYSLENVQGDYLAQCTINSFSNYLETCRSILQGFKFVVDHINEKDGEIDIYNVASLPTTLLQILLDIYQHCRDSEMLYGPVFPSVTSHLTDLFEKCSDLQGPFLTLLSEKINFCQSLQDDLPLVLSVLERLGLIGETVIQLNIKAMAELWKVYTKLVDKYREYLVERLDVSQPILFLSSQLSLIINNITKDMSEANSKSRMRHLKLATFLLKIIIKLCEEFEGAIGECHESLLNLVITLHGSSRVHSIGVTSEEVGEELYRYLTVGATPLLSHLMSDPVFVTTFKKKVDLLPTCDNNEKLGVFFVTLGILKHLVKSPSARNSWSCVSFIHSLLNCFKSCCDIIDFNLKFDEKLSYVCLVSMVGGYMINTASPSDFKEIEKMLFSLVFQPRVSPVVFASDLLCLLSRVSNEDVCLSQVVYLCKVVKSWPQGEWLRPERVHASWLLSRLFPLLSLKSKQKVMEMFPLEENVQLWSLLSHSSHNYVLQKLTEILDILIDPSTPLSTSMYNKFLELLTLSHSSFLEAQEKTPLMDIALNSLLRLQKQLLSCLHSGLLSCKDAVWLCHILTAFLNTTSAALHLMTNSQLSEVADLVSLTLCQKETSTTLACFAFLHHLPSFKLNPDYEKSLKAKLSSVVSSSLEVGPDPVVQFNCLSLASRLHQCKAISCPSLSLKGSAFASGAQLVPLLSDQWCPPSNSAFTHKCARRLPTMPHSKRVRPDDTVHISLAQNSIDNLRDIVQYVANYPVSPQLNTLLVDLVQLSDSLKAFI